MFIGTWTFADDKGRHPWSAKQVKAEIFPADNFTEKQILGWLSELENHSLIVRYSFENTEYFYISGWKHQRIDKPQNAKYPDPFQDNSKIIPRTIPPDTIRYDTIGKDTIVAMVANATDAKSRFDEFWKTFPRRRGSNPKKPAEKKFDLLVAAGTDPSSIIFGAANYAAELCRDGKDRTQFVAQAITWLNQSRFEDYQKTGEINGELDTRTGGLVEAGKRLLAKLEQSHSLNGMGPEPANTSGAGDIASDGNVRMLPQR